MIRLRVFNPQKPEEMKEIDLQPEASLNHECLIGRAPNCKLLLEDGVVSRMHGKICYRDGNYYFTDLGSMAGSWVNAESAKVNQAYPLRNSDNIRIGPFVLTVTSFDTETIVPEPAQPAASNATVIEMRPSAPPKQLDESPQSVPSQPTAPAFPNLVEMPRWTKGELSVRCVQVIDETHDVKTFRFTADPPVLFIYKPGQFVTLDLEIEGELVSRSYSISSTPSRPHTLEITVKRVAAVENHPPGQVSNWLHDHVKVGSQIQLSGPTGKFTCADHPSRKLLLISAGSGITPMMSMARWICDTAADQDIVFFHSARSPRDIIFRQELESLSARHPNFRLIVTTTRTEPGQSWSGLTGRMDGAMLPLVTPDFRDRTIYVCGPNPFMEGVATMLESVGFPMENYFEESFGAPRKKAKPSASVSAASSNGNAGSATQPNGLKELFKQLPVEVVAVPSDRPVAPAPVVSPPAAPASSGTAVCFSKSNQEVACDGEDPILDVAEQAGVKIRSSCRSGVCGSCKKRKLEGQVRMEGYDSEALEESEVQEGYILTCMAYPIGRVVVDA